MKLITLENLKSFWKDVKSYVDNGLSKKADSVHGTHVTYGTINGKAPGTASAGTSSKVAREDHVHPVQTTVSGNAGTATKLQTARTITLKGRANGSASFDGSGNIIIDTNPKMFESGGTSGTSGYVAVAQLKITGSYANRPTEFKLVSRGRETACTVSVTFANADSTDPALSSIRYWGTNYGVFIHKSATSTWLLYATKSEAHDSIAVVDCCYGSQSITITYPGSFITEKPTSNITNASLGGSFGQANTANSATKATQDSAGQQINTTYIKGLSVSGKTITYTKGDGSTGTITTQDTNTDTNTTYTLSKSGSTITLTGSDGKTTSVSDSNTTYSTGTTSASGLTKLYTATGTATDGTLTQKAITDALKGKSDTTHTHSSLEGISLSGVTATLNNYNLSSGSPKFVVYFCPTDGDGSNITGRPNDSDKKAFNLIVESLRYVSSSDFITKQTYTQGSQKITYVRYNTNGTWTAWEKVYTSTQKPTLSELGAASTATATTSANGLMTSAMVTKLNGIATNANNYSHPTTSGNKHIPAGGSSGQILRWSADGTAVWGADNNTTYSTGTTSTAGLTKLYTGTGTATDGTMTQAALKTALDGKAASSHTHSYLPLSGGTLTGAITLGKSTAGKINHTKTDGTVVSTLYITENNNVKLGDGGTQLNIYSSANPNVYIGSTAYKMYHTGNKPSYSDVGAAASSHTHNYAGSSSAGGAANSATKLATARTINGTSFDGSANITTANWGTARTLTIGSTGKSVNGSGNVSWSLSEIGAAAASHTHNYVPTSDYSLTTISKTLTLTTSWQDTGITGSNLSTGTYIVQVSGMNSEATSFYQEIWSGTMSWFQGTTNSTDSDEIILHKAGHSSNGRTIYLRTIRTSNSGYLKLQIASSHALSSSNITFKFRKLI